METVFIMWFQSGRMSTILCELHHCFSLLKWGWTSWMLLCFVVSGALSLVTVHQPPVLAAALGHDVIMPCELQLQDEKLRSAPILYWWKLQQERDDVRLWTPSETYVDRVGLLDNNTDSLNKSIILKDVQWADSGRYRCKLSINTEKGESFRKRGNTTSVVVYDSMLFNLTKHCEPLLRCEVNVTQDAGFVLHIFHEGQRVHTGASDVRDAHAALPYVSLSETIPLQGHGKYECQLHLKEDLITTSVFHSDLPVAEEGGDSGKNLTTTCSSTAFEVYPEPWFLYVALLLVPIAFLLGLVTAMLIRR